MENLVKRGLVFISGLTVAFISFQLIFCRAISLFISDLGDAVILKSWSPIVIFQSYKLIITQLHYNIRQIIWFLFLPSSIWIFCVAMIVAILRHFIFANLKKPLDNVYGSAKWATYNDIIDSGLFNNQSGVVLGEFKTFWGNKLIIEESQNEHVLAYGPSRSGKGIGLIIPTIFKWQDSKLILDPKRELYESTAESLRREGYIVYCLDLGDVFNRYNPLSELKKGDKKLFKEVNEIVNILLEASQAKGENAVFTRNAVTLLRSIILYLVEQGNAVTLTQLAYMVSGLNILTGEMYQIKDLLAQMKNSKNPQVAADANRFFEDANMENPRTFRSFMTDIEKNLAIFKDNILADITSKSDFSVYDLLDMSKPPIALFLSIPSADAVTGSMDTVAKLILHNILVNALYKTGRRDKVNGAWSKRALLCLFDEFPSIGKFEPMEKLLADAGGFGAKFYLIAQDDQQIDRYYGEKNSIFAATTHKVLYAPNDIKTAERISKFLGTYTVVEQQTSINTQLSGSTNKSKSVNKSYIRTKKDLLSPTEVLNLPPTDSIIMTQTPKTKLNIYGKKFRFFDNKEFLSKVTLSLDEVKKSDDNFI